MEDATLSEGKVRFYYAQKQEFERTDAEFERTDGRECERAMHHSIIQASVFTAWRGCKNRFQGIVYSGMN